MDDDTLIGAIYSTVTRDEVLASLLELLARRFRCGSAALVYVDPRHPEASLAAGYGVTARPEVQELYRTRYANDDPAPAAMARLRVGEVAATDRLFDDRFKETSRFIQEFYHPIGLREAMGGPFANEGGRFGLLAVVRGEERPPFDDEDIALLGRFILHAKRAADLRDAFFRVEASAATLESVLDDIPTAVMAFDRRKALTHANAAARAILARADGLELSRTGRVRATNAKVDARLQILFNHPHLVADYEILCVPRGEERAPYVVRAMPVRRGSAVALSLKVSEPDLPFGDVAAALRSALRLNEPSARLVEAILNGEDLASYGRRAGISHNTVKFHLKTAFQVTGCRRQADLARIAGAVIKDLGS
jgi:GAF domain-containing protein